MKFKKQKKFVFAPKETLAITLIISLIFVGSFWIFEPEQSKAVTANTSISLTVTGEITISCSSTAALSPSLPGQSGGIATTTFSCAVNTNDSSGYNLTLVKSQKLQITDTANERFDNYNPATTTAPDYNWGSVGAGNEEFGFAVNSGVDTVTKFKDNGSACNAGGNVTAWKCWWDIPTTPSSSEQVATRSTSTGGSAITTTFGLEAEAGSSNALLEGSYTTTSTATALVNS